MAVAEGKEQPVSVPENAQHFSAETDIGLDRVTKRFDDVVAVDGISL